MNTGNGDDAAFSNGQMVTGGIAIFDHSGDDDHIIFQVLNFQFK